MTSTQQEREKFYQNTRVELILNNFGLPPMPGYKNMDWPTAVNTFKAIQELDVRLKLWTMSSRPDSGVIDFPEAKRVIEYHFDGKNVKKNKMALKTLVKKHYVWQ